MIRMARSRRRRTLLATLCLLLAVPMVAEAQSVLLRIKPRAGDTLHTRFEQDMEIIGRTRVGGGDTTVTMRSGMLLLSRVIVESSDDEGTVVLAVTDSLAITGGGRSGLIPESQRRAMQSGRVRMRISAQGTASVLDAPASFAPDLQAVVSQMPAMLPEVAVRVGSTWRQTMTIPFAGQPVGGAAVIQATFRLDSLTRGGDLAHISMRGTISRDGAAGDLPNGARLESSGSLTGRLQMDRRRGWWSDTRATITMHSTMHPPAGTPAQPMRFETRITHRMRTEGRR